MGDLITIGLIGFVLGVTCQRSRRKRVDLYLGPPMPRPRTPDLPEQASAENGGSTGGP